MLSVMPRGWKGKNVSHNLGNSLWIRQRRGGMLEEMRGCGKWGCLMSLSTPLSFPPSIRLPVPQLLFSLSSADAHEYSFLHARVSARLPLESWALTPDLYLQLCAIDTVVSDPVRRDRLIEISHGIRLFWHYKRWLTSFLVTPCVWFCGWRGTRCHMCPRISSRLQ